MPTWETDKIHRHGSQRPLQMRFRITAAESQLQADASSDSNAPLFLLEMIGIESNNDNWVKLGSYPTLIQAQAAAEAECGHDIPSKAWVQL
jgi:hypothetical protein